MLTVLAARPVAAQVHIENLQIGFGPSRDGEGSYKVGKWAPVRLLIRCEQQGFDGLLEISGVDSDDVAVTVRRPVHVPANETIAVPSYFKPGEPVPTVSVRLVDSRGRTRGRASYQAADGDIPAAADLGVHLIVAAGRPAGLDPERFGARPGYSGESFRVARLESFRRLPARWYGYEAADFVVLCVEDAESVQQMDVAAQAALRRWVRGGGRLIVTVASAWPQLKTTFLADMLPADFGGAETVEDLRALEAYVGSRAAMQVRGPLSVPKLVNLRGRILAGTQQLPLAVRGPYGLGFVTIVPLDVSRRPFVDWEGRADFWLKLLDIPKEKAGDLKQSRAWMRYALNDLSSHLRRELEQFVGVALVPFGWVAFFIFLYIVLIGPVDYLLVKKVLRRMELTWVTFPVMVAAVAVLAYYSAYWLKGDELRINKVDVVDIDAASGTLRGTSWFTLFSPKVEHYTIGLEPAELGGGVTDEATGLSDQAGGPSMTVSWLGLAEDAIGGMGRRGGMTMFRRGYRFGPEAATLEQVPIQVWSMKGFWARWLGQARPPVEADLQAIGTDRLRGTVTNRSSARLEQAVVVFGRRSYPLGTLAPGQQAVVEAKSPLDLYGELTRRGNAFRRSPSYAYYRRSRRGEPEVGLSHSGRLADLIFTMMFYARLPKGDHSPTDNYFSDLDLSQHLNYGRAILVARTSGPTSLLVLNGQKVSQGIESQRFLRVLLPVRPGGREVEFSPPE